MRGIGRQVTQEHPLLFPYGLLFFHFGAGMEPGVVEDHDGQLISGSVTGEFVDEGDHVGALDALLDQLEVKSAFFLAPIESADQVEPAVTAPSRRNAQAVL